MPWATRKRQANSMQRQPDVSPSAWCVKKKKREEGRKEDGKEQEE